METIRDRIESFLDEITIDIIYEDRYKLITKDSPREVGNANRYATIDATIDATNDATIDATIDATNDATNDATIALVPKMNNSSMKINADIDSGKENTKMTIETLSSH